MEATDKKAMQIVELVAAGTCIVAHRRVPKLSLGTSGTQDARGFTRLEIAGDTSDDVREVLGWCRDAAKALGVTLSTVKRRGYSLFPRYADTYTFSPMDWHAEMKVWE